MLLSLLTSVTIASDNATASGSITVSIDNLGIATRIFKVGEVERKIAWEYKSTKSSAVAERPRDASCHSIFC